jgi:radical SAM enzyme (rSAM/lipoprotein system)
MPAEDFLQQMKKLRNHVKASQITVVLTGGEPLLRKDLEYIGNKLRHMGYRWSIVTNGMLYNNYRHHSLINAGMGALTLSLDGLRRSHNWLRNNALSFNKAIQALEYITKEKRLNYDVVTCVHKDNIHELEPLKELLIRKGVKAWRIFTIAPKGRATGNETLQLDGRQFRYLMEFIRKYRRHPLLKVSFSCEGFVGPYEGEVRDGYFFCRAGIHIGSILADGSVSACPNIDRQLIQGSIYKNDFHEIWESEFQKMRQRNWTKIDECEHCNMYKYCLGNGLHLWDMTNTKLLQCHYHLIV